MLIDQKLDVVYGCVQGGHAVAQWTLNLRVTGLNPVWSTLRRNETDI